MRCPYCLENLPTEFIDELDAHALNCHLRAEVQAFRELDALNHCSLITCEERAKNGERGMVDYIVGAE